MYSTYILESRSTGKWYYGSTGRLEERLKEHNFENGLYTDGRGPWVLIFKRTFSTEVEAREFERYLKKNRNKDYIRSAYSEYFLKPR